MTDKNAYVTGSSRLDQFLPKPTTTVDVNAKPPEDDHEDVAMRTSGAWRNSTKMPLLAVVLEFANGNAPSVLYGSIVGSPYLDPSRGIQFIFEGLHCKGWDDWADGLFKVSIHGGNLEVVRNRLIAGLRAVIREQSEENEDLNKLKTQVDKILVEPWEAPPAAE